MLQGIPEKIIVGSHIWVGDPELVWIDGEVLKINGEEAEIQTSNGNTVIRDFHWSAFSCISHYFSVFPL